MDQVHYEVFIKKQARAPWVLDLATEDRARAIETADEILAEGRACSVKVTKETLDGDTREFRSVTILTKGVEERAGPKQAEVEHEPLCVSPSDLYTIHARERIGRLLEGFLGRERATPFELLHRPDLIEKLDASGMELQHAVQKISIPEAQARGLSVHEIIRHFQKLIQTAIERVMKDGRRGAFPDLTKEAFAAAAARLVGDPERHYLLGGAVGQELGRAKTWGEKVGRLLDLADAAPQEPAARTLAFQVLETPLAEILGSRLGLAELLGPDLDLGASLAAMTRLAANEAVEMLISVEPKIAKQIPFLTGEAARLGNWLDGAHFEAVRAALGQRVLREIKSVRRLRDDGAAEIEILRALAMALTAAAGRLMPLEQVQEAFVERSRMLVRSDFVEAYLGEGLSAADEAEALLKLAENVTGPANKRAAGRWIAAVVTSLKFEKEIRFSPDGPASKLAALAGLQKAIARAGLVEEQAGPIRAKIGEVGGAIEADAKLVATLGKANAPAAQRLSMLLRMASGEVAPQGPAAARARAEALRLIKDPDTRADIARSPELVDQVRELMQSAALAA